MVSDATTSLPVIAGRGCIVLKLGAPVVWDPARRSLQSYFGTMVTVFRDRDEADYYILKTVERWSDQDRMRSLGRQTFQVVDLLLVPEAAAAPEHID